MIYLDLLVLLNFFYDFILLWTIGIALKRIIKFKRIFLSAIIGAISFLIVLADINLFLLLIYKLLFAIIMVIFAFGYKNFKYTISNLTYLYMCSVILAGFLLFLDNEINANYIFLLFFAPLILLLYIYQTKKLRQKQNLMYCVKIVLKNNKILNLNGFVDSGNRLKDPVTNKSIIIVNKNIYNNKDPIYVPYKTLNKTSLMKCFSLKYIEINNQKYNNYLLGVSDEVINIEGADCLLNYKILEDINV